jgi:hypothetical protein
MENPLKTAYQVLHLKRLSALFGVDTTPAESLSGEELDAWMRKAEDQIFDGLWRDE